MSSVENVVARSVVSPVARTVDGGIGGAQSMIVNQARNGDFSEGSSDWTAGTVAGGRLVFTAATIGSNLTAAFWNGGILETGDRIRVRLNVAAKSGALTYLYLTGASTESIITINAATVFDVIHTVVNGENSTLRFASFSASTMEVESIQVWRL